MRNLNIKPLTNKNIERLTAEYVEEMTHDGVDDPDRLAYLLDEDTLNTLNQELHPTADPYNYEVVRLMREIKRRQRHIDRVDILAIEHLVRGRSLEDIAEKEGVTLLPSSINTPKVRKLTELISSLYLLRLGVTKEQRANMLWRIAVKNEDRRPDISIAAISTINKMFGDNTPQRLAPGDVGGSGGVTIIVQNQALTNAPLDEIGG